MAGHVFVAQGDITRLHCDAWLLPSDRDFNVGAGWRGNGAALWSADLTRLWRRERRPPAGWGSDKVRVVPLENAPGSEHAPQVFLVDVGRWAGTPTEWYMDGVRQFFIAIAARGSQQITNRPKRLVALPLVGTGDGGGVDKKGDIIRELLATLKSAAAEYELDIVLVARGARAFTAIQHARWQLVDADETIDRTWPELSAQQRELAITLAGQARTDNLVLFLGAGVSMGAGLPSWDGLLDDLAIEAHLDAQQRVALKRLPQTDRARIIQGRMQAQGTDLGAVICRRLTATRYSLAHSLLATLPVSEVVTLNYDQLFEMAATDAERPATILPYQPSAGQERWLLKLHGCVQHSDDIVLTREDYLRYADRRAALSGIVQALLITRHMLFVGFSLTDEHFQQIVDDVRKALLGTGHDLHKYNQFGTALFLQPDSFLEELWRESVHQVALAAPDIKLEVATRQLDIFLDLLLAEASRGTAPLLDPTYDGLLTAEERELRELLHILAHDASPALRSAPTWRPIDRLLRELGGEISASLCGTDINGNRTVPVDPLR